jgi:putative RNA 2'-phosphotransferase
MFLPLFFLLVTDKEKIRTSKFLSRILRHEPESVGLRPDDAGWVNVLDLVSTLHQHGRPLSTDQLLHIIATSDKQRFALSKDGQFVRANQGHSIPVDLKYPAQPPPEILYHGTARRFLESIRKQGLRKMKRHAVHLLEQVITARKVGARHGEAVILVVQAGEMHRVGHVFCRSTNNVWLVDHVPPQFIEFEAGSAAAHRSVAAKATRRTAGS